MRRLGIVVVAVVALAACGDSDSPSADRAATTVSRVGGVAADPTCEPVLADAFFQREGQVVVSTSTAGMVGCSLSFRGDSGVLPKLGLRSQRQFPEASITVAFDLDAESRRWTYDADETAALDNGACLRP